MIEKLEELLTRYEFLCEYLSGADATKDMKTFQKYAKEKSDLEEIVAVYKKYLAEKKQMEDDFSEADKEADKELKELFLSEAYALKNGLGETERQLKILLLPKDKNDERSCMLELRAGAGGEEAALFAGELKRMYLNFCQNKRLKVETVSENKTELGGIKEAVYSVSGKGAYKLLKYESGVHRVQRVPETETQGRIHTSTATVAVLPEAEEVEVEINEKDIRLDIFHSSGAGGQNVNKVASAVRITHFPTGIVVVCQDERSQLKNKERAFQILRTRLYDFYNGQAQKSMDSDRRSLVGTGDRSERIRTYNFPQDRITDHRIGLTQHNLEGFLSGEIEPMIEALSIAETQRLLGESEKE